MLRKKLFIFACATALLCMSQVHAATKAGRYAVALENGNVATYAFDPTTGQLRIIQSVAVSTNQTATLSSLTVHPNNKFVYVTTGTNLIAGFEIGTTGLLTPLAGSPFPTNNDSAVIYFTPSGKFAYTENWPDSGEAFSVNTTTGALTSLGSVNFGDQTSDLAITPKGNYLYAANNGSNTMSGFAINATTGALTAVLGSPFPAGNGCASDWVHPSGKFVYCQNFSSSESSNGSIS